MKTGVAAGVRVIRLINSVVDTALLILILLLIVFGCYAIWDSEHVFVAAQATQYEIYKPTVEREEHSFAELKELNPEVIGWLTVYGTSIDYPLTQSTDNWKYINTDALGRHSLSGALFLDSKCSADFSEFSSIIYGHHMEKKAMFGELGQFAEAEYFAQHKYGMLYFEGAEHGLEFFAFVHTSAYDSTVFRTGIQEPEERESFGKLLSQRAMQSRDIELDPADRLVLLSTCSEITTNGRSILAGRIVDELFTDVFKENETDSTPTNIAAIDAVVNLWQQAAWWARIIAIALPLLLLAALAARKGYVHKRKDEWIYLKKPNKKG
ncbi:MAG: class B sortase [Firmicutes bacterium]|nr:class B sortase [Bacillota bacterium]